MKIAFLSEWNPFDLNQRSGVPYFIASALEANQMEVVHIPVEVGRRLLLHRILGRMLMFLFNTLLRKKMGFLIQNRSREYARSYARQAEKLLRNSNADAVFATGTIPIAYLRTEKPVILWLDATFANLYNYYTEFSHYHPLSLAQGHRTEKAALSKASLCVFCSSWAAEAAIRKYQCAPQKVRLIPRGANLADPPPLQEIQAIFDQKDFKVCRILFIGSNWQRKGGPIVLDTCRLLHSQGFPLELHLVGSSPSDLKDHPNWLYLHGRLSKADKRQQAQMEKLLRQAHFLFVPTRAEAFGIVYTEASAYGIPSLGTDTGGVGAAILNGKNGQRFAYDASLEEYIDYISKIFNDHQIYRQFAESAHATYQEHFDWKKNVALMLQYLKEIQT